MWMETYLLWSTNIICHWYHHYHSRPATWRFYHHLMTSVISPQCHTISMNEQRKRYGSTTVQRHSLPAIMLWLVDVCVVLSSDDSLSSALLPSVAVPSLLTSCWCCCWQNFTSSSLTIMINNAANIDKITVISFLSTDCISAVFSATSLSQ